MTATAEENAGVSLRDVFAQVPDPRGAHGKRFPLSGIFTLALAGLLAGRQGLAAIARWGRECSAEQLRRLGIERDKAPCHATYHNVFKVLECGATERALAEWTRRALPPGAAAAMDGKTLRGSRYADYPAVHLLSIYCDQVAGVLGQRAVETDKTNEIKAAVELLKAVPVKGMIITGDAIFAQKEICQDIRNQGGDYVFTVKDNQPGLREAIDQAFAPAASPAEEKKEGGIGEHGLPRGEKAGTRGRAKRGSHGPVERIPGLAGRGAGVPDTASARGFRKGERRGGVRHHQPVAEEGRRRAAAVANARALGD